MNMEYNVKNAIAYIKDENNNLTTRAYVNNIEQILEKENLIEEIEKNLEEVKEQIERLIYNNKQAIVKCNIYPIGSLILYFVGAQNYNNLINYLAVSETLFKVAFYIDMFLAYCSLGIFLMCGPLIIKTIHKLNHFKPNYQVLNYEEGNLKKFLNEEKQKLNELICKSQVETNIVKSSNVVDKQNLELFKNYLQEYQNLAKNYSRYQKYYQNNTLEEKLLKKKDKEGISLVRNFFKENEN